MACSVRLKDGRPCPAAPLRGGPTCYAHRNVELAGVTVTLSELGRLAEQFDREAGERWTAADFIAWVKPELVRRG